MKIVTWSRESHGLFDYEIKNINVKICYVKNSCNIYRNSFLFIFNFPPDESEVELVDYIENPEVKDGNLSYLTSVI